MSEAPHTPPYIPAAPLRQRGEQPGAIPGLRRRVAVTRLALLWEMLWQNLWRPICAWGFFLSLSLFDVWRHTPSIVHWFLLLALLSFSAVTLIQARNRFRLPDRRHILARIEQDNGLRHHPLRALEDQQALGDSVEEARSLWRAHQRRLLRNLPRLKFVPPHPGAIRFDRHGLRQIAGILLIAGSIAAGSQWWPRIEAGFSPARLGPALPPSRLEAWITPPGYTRAAPVMLAGAAFDKISQDVKAEPSTDATAVRTISVPAGSELSMRLFSGREAGLRLVPDNGEKQRLPMTRIDSANSHVSVRLEHSQSVQLREPGSENREWRINVIPDQPPVISLLEDITVTRQFSLRFKYGVTDDYGVVAAGVDIMPEMPENTPKETPLKIEFPAPQSSVKGGQTAYADLGGHPWAGRRVQLRLRAVDAAGQSGYSNPVSLVLPQRVFSNPLARAIIEQRRNVALTPKRDADTIRALDALSLFPQKFTPETGIYLPMRVARHRIAHLHGNEDARTQTVDLLWQLALRIEDGDLSIAGNEIRALQKALMQALQNGASDTEISKLTQALREALERYVQEMAEQALEEGMQPQTQDGQDNSEMIEKSDLDELLDNIEKLSRSGARDAAQQMLSKLQNILENMRPGQAGGQQSAKQLLYGNALNDLSSMMRQQQKLQDETYTRRKQDNSGGDKNGGEKGKGDNGGLAAEQDELGGALGGLNNSLEQQSPGETPNSLRRAERAMRDAAEALRQGESAEALDQQRQAMDQLRAGAGALAKSLREEDAKARAENGESGESGAPRNDKDPLGRPMTSDAGTATVVPEQFGIERALQIRRELELRASQRRRPAEELNYIDRLLKLF